MLRYSFGVTLNYCLSSLFFSYTKGDECEIKTVGITLESETWKSALNNRESIEFKTLQANLLSEVSIL